MKIEIAEHGRMTESGSSLLRLIQNQSMPLLDLLVRETVQNSLDATNKKEPSVKVDISVKDFQARELNKNFDSIHHALNSKFPSKQPYKCIVVRDSNTLGLTGPVRYKDVVNNEFGNLLKLVYEICKPQQNEGAGGSWGLGKTIYFRVGIGLVIYYSRIFQDGKYVSRLAACFVEDETKADSIIPSHGGVKRGIAWWGDSDGKNKTVPIENEREIQRILSVFDISLYTGKETGTTVIIPYINQDNLLHEVYAKNEDAEHKPYWTIDIESYVSVALQRWYAPRFLNTQYSYGAYLSPSVNGKKLSVAKMLPLFRVIRELYILAHEKNVEESFIKEAGVSVAIESINVREVFVPGTSCAGKLAFLKMTEEQLRMLPPQNNKSPYQQITNCIVPMEEGKNTPIIMFTRRPGMIVGYDFDGTWTHRMPHTNENEFIIGLFVANSTNKMKDILDNNTHEEISLEEYIRQGEKADHAAWTDRNISGTNPRVISKIQNGVITKISRQFREKDLNVTEKKNIGLGHALGNILLPSSGFGRRSITPTPPTPVPTPPVSSKRSKLTVTSQPVFDHGLILVNYELTLKKNCVLNLQVVTDFKKLCADEWENEEKVGKKFPLSFKSFDVLTLQKTGEKEVTTLTGISVTPEVQNKACDNLEINIKESKHFGTFSSIHLSIESACTLTGIMTFITEDSRLKGVFELKEDK